ncbi:MAG: hypothetical protein HY737_02895 [Candidatus Omnitrophica bacterium]|nr:hypothetical protein [Candidatus Omnitrophota bacterium]
MHRAFGIALLTVVLCGCGVRTSSLLLERHARGPIAENASIAHRVDWKLEPLSQTQTQKNVDVIATFGSQSWMKDFFSNRNAFGAFAGMNPYFLENIVFYVRVANKSTQPILINPPAFVLIDDRGNQYTPINEDYVNAIAEAKAPVAVATRGMLEDARPGYFGVGVPIGKLVNTRPQGRFALIKQSSLQSGYLYPSVTYDGLVAFWSPSHDTKSLKLVLTDIKTDFNANNEPQASLEFPFTFQVVPPKK